MICDEIQLMDVEDSSTSAIANTTTTSLDNTTMDMDGPNPATSSSFQPDFSIVQALRRQEESGYGVVDYFNLPHVAAMPMDGPNGPPADASCRFFMAQWCYQIVDHCNFQRETATISMSYLDRFLASEDGQRNVLPNRNMFQLAAMSCLYTAVKIHEHEAVTPDLIAQLSHGAHSKTDVEAMELRILKALQWRVNPPTPSTFVHEFMAIIPEFIMPDQALRSTAIDLAQFQTELSVTDYRMVTYRASWVALSALLNATESLLDGERFAYLESLLCHAAGIDFNTTSPQIIQLLQEIRVRLYEAIADESGGGSQGAAYAPAPSTSSQTEENNTKMSGLGDDSPRTVSHPQ